MSTKTGVTNYSFKIILREFIPQFPEKYKLIIIQKHLKQIDLQIYMKITCDSQFARLLFQTVALSLRPLNSVYFRTPNFHTSNVSETPVLAISSRSVLIYTPEKKQMFCVVSSSYENVQRYGAMLKVIEIVMMSLMTSSQCF